MPKFIHKRTKRIVDLPAHFATAKIGKNFEPYVEGEFEEDKVVVSHAPNSQSRVAKFATKPKAEEPATDEDED